MPNLEIENNDVHCSHASTVGPIDEDQRFYLESRGVPPEVAERLIVAGFFDEVLDQMPDSGRWRGPCDGRDRPPARSPRRSRDERSSASARSKTSNPARPSASTSASCRIAVVRIDDDWYAIGDTCTHQDISLSEGEVDPDDLEIECWKHGSSFLARHR